MTPALRSRSLRQTKLAWLIALAPALYPVAGCGSLLGIGDLPGLDGSAGAAPDSGGVKETEESSVPPVSPVSGEAGDGQGASGLDEASVTMADAAAACATGTYGCASASALHDCQASGQWSPPTECSVVTPGTSICANGVCLCSPGATLSCVARINDDGSAVTGVETCSSSGYFGACEECLSSLSGIGTADFRIAFTLTTTAAGDVALVNQRSGCDMTSTWWEVNMQGGDVGAATNAGSGEYASVGLSSTVNDGRPHRIVVGRTGGQLWYSIDSVRAAQVTPDAWALGTFPALSVGADECPGYVSLDRSELTDLCMSSP